MSSAFTNRSKAIALYIIPSLIALLCLQRNSLSAQELEPRALTNVPIGMNFALIGYGYSVGDILLDPAVPIENLNANLHTVIGAYVRSINFFGLSGKVDVIVPYATGDWTGVYTGIDTSTSRTGFGDMRFRLSFNFFGAPALKKSQFPGYKPKNISGLSIQLIAPTGQYFPDRLINLGSNRWVLRPQCGFSHTMSKWIVESYLSLWLFTNNTDFWGGNELKQKPLGTIKIHTIRILPKRMWLALDTGYGIGGRTYLNGEEKDTRISTFRFGLTLAKPFGNHHVFRINGTTGVRLERGSEFSAMNVAYQFRW